MNIFDKRLPQRYEYCVIDHLFNKDKRTESIIIRFSDDDDEKVEQDYLVKDASPGTAWMKFLDFDMPDEDSTFRAYEKLKELEDVLPVSLHSSPKKLLAKLESYTRDDYKKMVDDSYAIIEAAVKLSPMMIIVFANVFDFLADLHWITKKKEHIQSFVSSDSHRLKELDDFIKLFPEVYSKAREFCEHVFLIDDNYKYKIDPNDVYDVYQLYCSHSDQINYYKNPILPSSKQKRMKNGELDQFIGSYEWPEFYKFSCEPSDPLYGKEYDVDTLYSVEDFILVGIRDMLSCHFVLRRCKLCGGIFKIRFFTVQECCTRPYKDTNVPCNEYLSRRYYKKRTAEHPLHSAYTKAYNRLYGRIRRGHVPADTLLNKKLMDLHEKYTKQYEAAYDESLREAIVKDFIEDADKLLG